jgi:hypothetical protein
LNEPFNPESPQLADVWPPLYTGSVKSAFTLLVLSLVAVAYAEEPRTTSFQTYPVAFCDPHAAEQSVRAVVGEEGSVVLDGANQRLLVVTTKERHALIADMIGKMNVPPKNVRIDVQFSGRSIDREKGAEVGVAGQVTRIEGITHTTIRFNPRVKDSTTQASSDVRQSLVIASGREGVLCIGESVPYLEWLSDYGMRCGYIRAQLNWQEVGSLLVVEPIVMGDGPMIRVRLTPEISGLVAGSPYCVRFASVATEIVTTDGQTFQLAASDQNRDFYSKFLIGFDRAGGQQTLDISLTARILGGAVTTPLGAQQAPPIRP